MHRKFLVLAAALLVCSCGPPTRPMPVGPTPTLYSVDRPGMRTVCLHTSDPGGCFGDIAPQPRCTIYSHGCRVEY
ncbi:MAG TPA: hypothetical protein VL625_11700 [Patescibacteria group bacterium]|jgi:hypothetical protein|nr:hypothetical protein [Patescibacteria group bacterium]